MPYAKNHIRVNVPHRSGFDKSHRNSGTLTCGTLTPILCDELIPSSRVSLKLNLAAQLPPLASDTYMNLKLKTEAFFVPSRLCSGSFEDFFCDVDKTANNNNTSIQVHPRVPILTPTQAAATNQLGPGSLADYLGVKVEAGREIGSINALPFIAYHLIWQEWYRNPRVQNPCFLPEIGTSYAAGSALKSAPYFYFRSPVAGVSDAYAFYDLGNSYSLADGVSIYSLRQRNFGLDYFTGARLSAQQGDAVSLNVPTAFTKATVENEEGSPVSVPDVSGTNTISAGFTIAALRAANSLQMFRERNNIPSPRLVDQVKARYGAVLSDGVAQRPICIGSATYDVSSTGISQTAADANSGSNPFDTVGSQYGRAYASGSDFIISDFTCNEPGYLFVLISLVPVVTYSSGIERMFRRYVADGSIAEMANPLLQNVGDQPISVNEFCDGPKAAVGSTIFGYQDRFADFMFKYNSVHGLMRDGQTLQSYVLQRSWFLPSGASIPPQLNSAFLEIPTTYLDGVFAVSSAVQGFSAWYDCVLDYKVSMPLAEFSIPSLQDPAYEHGKPVSLRRNGQIF